jgi:hypothetical protein
MSCAQEGKKELGKMAELTKMSGKTNTLPTAETVSSLLVLMPRARKKPDRASSK